MPSDCGWVRHICDVTVLQFTCQKYYGHSLWCLLSCCLLLFLLWVVTVTDATDETCDKAMLVKNVLVRTISYGETITMKLKERNGTT